MQVIKATVLIFYFLLNLFSSLTASDESDENIYLPIITCYVVYKEDMHNTARENMWMTPNRGYVLLITY